ncbi:hypothetical protein C8J56DRAFT_1037283 [Mycena floridula]|nr:hypothetical protein C8J56DRAFT_1037283 [Mycena floridula]
MRYFSAGSLTQLHSSTGSIAQLCTSFNFTRKMHLRLSTLFILAGQIPIVLVSAAPIRRSVSMFNDPKDSVNLDTCPGDRFVSLTVGKLDIQYCETPAGAGEQGSVHFAKWQDHTGVLKVYKSEADFNTEHQTLKDVSHVLEYPRSPPISFQQLKRLDAEGSAGGKHYVVMPKVSGHTLLKTSYFEAAYKADGAAYTGPEYQNPHCSELITKVQSHLLTAMKDFYDKTKKVHDDPHMRNVLWPDTLGVPTLIDFGAVYLPPGGDNDAFSPC